MSLSVEGGFPLQWEQILWCAAPAFPLALVQPGTAYVLTDFRLVLRRRQHIVREVALDDIAAVTLTQSRWQRAIGTTSVRVDLSNTEPPLVLANILHGPQLALILQLRTTGGACEDGWDVDEEFLRSALGPRAQPLLRGRNPLVLAAALGLAATLALMGLAATSAVPPIAYGPADPIAPNGQRRSRADIESFMEQEVMPFARATLGPLVGAEQVSCETCHGPDGAARGWRMPGVQALPEPELRLAGLERSSAGRDPQLRNAVYGYQAREDKQSVAAYMRQVVMPGMARLMKRPAYDFARSYGYNREKAAVGCYHCHRVE